MKDSGKPFTHFPLFFASLDEWKNKPKVLYIVIFYKKKKNLKSLELSEHSNW